MDAVSHAVLYLCHELQPRVSRIHVWRYGKQSQFDEPRPHFSPSIDNLAEELVFKIL